MTARTFARWVFRAALALLALAAVAFLALLAINWRDRPPSADALEVERLTTSRAPVADGDNAYVYMLGMSVPASEDPARWGARRRAWLAALTAESPHPLAWPGRSSDARVAAADAIAVGCAQPTPACADLLRTRRQEHDESLARNGLRLARYEALIAHAHWLESVPTRFDAPLPEYQHAMEAQKHYLLATWRFAARGDAAGMRDRLDRDLRFWRGVLRDSDLLITKMIAAAAIRRNLGYGSLALRELRAADVASAVPSGWQEELAKDERSMRRVMAGEWNYSRAYMRDMASRTGDGQRLSPGERAGQPFFRLQDTLNRMARHALRFAAASEVPYPQLEGAVDAVAADAGAAWYRNAYNPIGATLASIAEPAYPDYAYRVANLEGMRRSALAAAMLRAAGVPHERVALELPGLQVRDPFTQGPLSWNASTRGIGFDGAGAPARTAEYVVSY